MCVCVCMCACARAHVRVRVCLCVCVCRFYSLCVCPPRLCHYILTMYGPTAWINTVLVDVAYNKIYTFIQSNKFNTVPTGCKRRSTIHTSVRTSQTVPAGPRKMGVKLVPYSFIRKGIRNEKYVSFLIPYLIRNKELHVFSSPYFLFVLKFVECRFSEY